MVQIYRLLGKKCLAGSGPPWARGLFIICHAEYMVQIYQLLGRKVTWLEAILLGLASPNGKLFLCGHAECLLQICQLLSEKVRGLVTWLEAVLLRLAARDERKGG